MNERKYERYYGIAGKASYENWDSVMRSDICGCYYCQSIFPPSEISPEDYTLDMHGKTVLCPHCMVDAVLGDASGIPINPEILAELCEYMF
jgi:hypothetical protein